MKLYIVRGRPVSGIRTNVRFVDKTGFAYNNYASRQLFSKYPTIIKPPSRRGDRLRN